MILESLTHATTYQNLHPLFTKAFDFLRNFNEDDANGRYELEGDRLYAMVQRYSTAPAETRGWESHQRYIDIQYVASGVEQCGFAPVDRLISKQAYHAEHDYELFEKPAINVASPILISSGEFAIFFPQDGHQPGVMVDRPESIVKVVVKVSV